MQKQDTGKILIKLVITIIVLIGLAFIQIANGFSSTVQSAETGENTTEALGENTNNGNLPQTRDRQKMDKKILLFTGLENEELAIPGRSRNDFNALQTALKEKYTTVDVMTSQQGSVAYDVVEKVTPIADNYDLVICDSYVWGTGNIANQDSLNYNLITISNDGDTKENNLINDFTQFEVNNSATITIQHGLFNNMTIHPGYDYDNGGARGIHFKDDVHVMATVTYVGDSSTYDAIGYKQIGEYKQIHSELVLNNDYVPVVSRLADFVFDNVDTIVDGDFVDFIKPNATYQHSETDIDHEGKTYSMVFDITDKFYSEGTLSLDDLAIRIDGEEPDWTKVSKSLQEEDRTNIVNGEEQVIGKRYTLTLSNLEQLQVKEGDNYLDYSGVVTVAIPADKLVDTTGNGNNATTITSGLTLPGEAASEDETEATVDVVDPLVEKVTYTVHARRTTTT